MNDNSTKELAKIARENRQFTIIRRERAIDETEKRRNRQAILAGIYCLGAVALVKFNGVDIGLNMLEQEMEALASWESLKGLFQEYGPGVTTMMFLGAVSAIKSLRNNRRLIDLRNEKIDFNNSIEYFQEPWDEMVEDTCNKDINEEREENHYVRTR